MSNARRSSLPRQTICRCWRSPIGSASADPWASLPTPQTKRGRFAETTIGYVHIDSCELRHADGRVHMFFAIDRDSKFTFVEFYDKVGKMNAAAFLEHPIEAFPTSARHCA